MQVKLSSAARFAPRQATAAQCQKWCRNRRSSHVTTTRTHVAGHALAADDLPAALESGALQSRAAKERRFTQLRSLRLQLQLQLQLGRDRGRLYMVKRLT
eukprot:TRINITY_DN3738_c0_g3_i1.p4 TRINITY_DN3738_c0_g3~~TRINITY_DN3738_c0_g3_i1.p4  ORF type:complete len:100 (+),score=12.56 TRINITY_DN3738_c0_g3_i1:691-990(+)